MTVSILAVARSASQSWTLTPSQNAIFLDQTSSQEDLDKATVVAGASLNTAVSRSAVVALPIDWIRATREALLWIQ